MWNATQTSYPYNTTQTNTPVLFQVGYPPGDRCDILDVQWDVSSSHSRFTGPAPCTPDNDSNEVIVFNSPGTVYVKAKITNSCGWSDWSYPQAITVTSGSYLYSVYPNPSPGEFTVGLVQARKDVLTDVSVYVNSPASISGIQMEIYDMNGQKVFSQNFNRSDNLPKVDVTFLKKGLYFLRIVGREVDETHQIVVD
jgi:hypothetical protein